MHARSFLLGILFSIFVAGLGIGVYFLSRSWKNSLPSGQVSTISLTDQSQPSSPLDSGVAMASPQPPQIGFDDSGAISDSDKQEIIQKIITPYLDYYKNADQGRVKSLIVTLNSKPNNLQYPYLVTARFDTGVTDSFLVQKQDDSIGWWMPVCQGPCLFTDDFRSKYPEVVKLAGQ